jgi:glycerol-3-phosphate dehydrogenase
MKVAVVGAGSWGTTIASVGAQHAQVTLWALEPAGMADGLGFGDRRRPLSSPVAWLS